METPLRMALLFVALLIVQTNANIQNKHTNINALNISMDELRIGYNDDTTSIIESSYNINTKLIQESFDMKLHLEDSWEFKANMQSKLILTFDGLLNITNDNENEFLFVFSSDNTQFFSFVTYIPSSLISNTNANYGNKIYPKSSIGYKNDISSWINTNNNNNNDDTISRSQRISDNNLWTEISSSISSSIQSTEKMNIKWSFTFEITNKPTTNQCIFSFQDEHDNDEQINSHNIFNNAFEDEEMDIYIMGGSLNMKYEISNINIQLIHGEDEDEDEADKNDLDEVLSLNDTYSNDINADNLNQTQNEINTTFILSIPTQNDDFDANGDQNENEIDQNNDDQQISNTRPFDIIIKDSTRQGINSQVDDDDDANNGDNKITQNTSKEKDDDKNIETWFVVILTATVLVFCCARLMMKILMGKNYVFCLMKRIVHKIICWIK